MLLGWINGLYGLGEPKNAFLGKIKHFLPGRVKGAIRGARTGAIWLVKALMDMIRFLRVQGPVTTVLGQEWRPSHDIIEIDITYECSLCCFSCDRICGQAPSEERMSVSQIDKFIKESINRGKRWRQITLLGGEPTMHPDLSEIVRLLLAYKRDFSPGTTMQLVTNGFSERTRIVLSSLPGEVKIKNSGKRSSRQEDFDTITVAPADRIIYRFADYSNGCDITDKCGMGLNMHGYYPCAPAGAIDRVLGLDIGRKTLPDDNDKMTDLMKIFCGYCGHFLCFNKINLNYNSRSWKKAFKKYKSAKPALRLY